MGGNASGPHFVTPRSLEFSDQTRASLLSDLVAAAYEERIVSVRYQAALVLHCGVCCVRLYLFLLFVAILKLEACLRRAVLEKA